MIIYLVGFMGAGKTTVGKKLATHLSYKFIDLDALIEKETGKTIVQLFEEGETRFREIESLLLRNTGKLNDVVIATGGGTPCFNNNMEWMNENGLTVYLKLSAGSLFHRLAASKKDRPLIAGKPDVVLMEYIMHTLSDRNSFYRKAKLIYKGEDLVIAELVGELQKNQLS